MSELKAQWDEVGERFAALGRHWRERYEERARNEGAEARAQVDDALRTLADAVDDVAAAIGDAVRDPATREQARQAGTSLGDALAATFGEVGEQIRRSFGSDADRQS